MSFRYLGASGLEVSEIGIGTNNFGARLDETRSARVVHAALDHDINLFDTANVYSHGVSEEYLGTAFTFNAICPGYVDTPIVSRNIDSISARAGVSREAALAMMVDANRHRRLIAPEEIAAAAMWLVGPGSQSTNGQTVEIAGGQV